MKAYGLEAGKAALERPADKTQINGRFAARNESVPMPVGAGVSERQKPLIEQGLRQLPAATANLLALKPPSMAVWRIGATHFRYREAARTYGCRFVARYNFWTWGSREGCAKIGCRVAGKGDGSAHFF
jgi:hypothetical protein